MQASSYRTENERDFETGVRPVHESGCVVHLFLTGPPTEIWKQGRVAAEIYSRAAPVLNDIERYWRDLKQHYLANRTLAIPHALDRTIHDIVVRLNRYQQLKSSPLHRRAA